MEKDLHWTSGSKILARDYPVIQGIIFGLIYTLVNLMVDVIDRLLGRGYDMGQVKKIMGGNWLRLYEEVWH